VVKLVDSKVLTYSPINLFTVFTLSQIITVVSLIPQSFQIPRVRDCSVTPQAGVDVIPNKHINALARSLSGKPDPQGHARKN